MAEALSSACFYQFVCTATALCTLSFYSMYVQLSPSKMIHLFFMLVGIIMETLIICYAAEEVGSSAEEICHAIYACNWIDQSLQFKRTLCFMLKRSQRPVGIWATRLLPVRMTTFLAVSWLLRNAAPDIHILIVFHFLSFYFHSFCLFQQLMRLSPT